MHYFRLARGDENVINIRAFNEIYWHYPLQNDNAINNNLDFDFFQRLWQIIENAVIGKGRCNPK